MNADKKSLETMFSIAGDKWQSKTVSNDFVLRSSIVLTFLIAAYPVWFSSATKFSIKIQFFVLFNCFNAMLCTIVLVRRITTTITGRNVETFCWPHYWNGAISHCCWFHCINKTLLPFHSLINGDFKQESVLLHIFTINVQFECSQ